MNATLVASALLLLILLVYSIVMNRRRRPLVAVAFDLDETLGYFTQLGLLKDVIERYERKQMSQDDFNRLIDDNPEFIRPGILEILKFVVNERDKGRCDTIVIYTNNNGAREWTESIGEYFGYKLGKPVFDQYICAYKVNGRKVEPLRTTHDKTYADFLRCTRTPRGTRVCFFDDIIHPYMKHANVFYVNAKGYTNKLPVYISLQRRYRANRALADEAIAHAINTYGEDAIGGDVKPTTEQDVDVIIGKFMLQHTKDFFKAPTRS